MHASRWQWLPAPLLLVAMILLRVANLTTSFESSLLLLIGNFTFVTLASAAVLYLAARSFLASGSPSLLLLGCGVAFLGVGSTLSTTVGGKDFGVSITIHNLCSWFSALCHLFSVVLSDQDRRWRRPALCLTTGFLITVLLASGIAAAAAAGWTPLFFVQGQGGTPLRHVVLGSGCCIFAMSSLLLFARHRQSPSAFTLWYAPGLMLIAVSLFGLMIQNVHGSVLGWTSRATAWLGSLYLIFAVVAGARAPDAGKITLIVAPSDARTRYALAIAFVVAAVVLRMIFLPLLGSRAVMITFFPAVILASLYGGRGPGLLAALLSVLAVNFFWDEPFTGFTIWHASDWLVMGLFLAVCVAISYIAEGMQQALAREAGQKAAEGSLRESEREQRMLANIGELGARIKEPGELLRAIEASVATELGISRCGYSQVNLKAGTVVIEHDYHKDLPSLAGSYALAKYAEHSREASLAGRSTVIDDLATDPRTAALYEETFAPMQVRAYISVPLHRQGEWTANFWASHHEAHPWRPAEISFMRNVADRVALVMEQVRTERELRLERNRLSLALMAGGMGVFEWDRLTNGLWWSPEIYPVFGQDAATFQPTLRGFEESVHPEDRPGLWQQVEEASPSHPSFHYEFRIIRPDGMLRWVANRASTEFDSQGRPLRTTGVAVDVTERRQALEDLRSAKEQAETALRAKDHFLAALSHELRTPLTPVIMTAASLAEEESLSAEVKGQLAVIQRNVALEARLIDDLLDLTRISRGKLALHNEPCEVHALVDLAIEIVRDEATAKGLSLQREFTARHTALTGDPARLQQVFWNLLRNAVKFTPGGGHILVRSSDMPASVAGESGRISVEVRDSGIGFAPAVAQRIFEPFEQAAAGHQHRFGGLGLGLSIAKAVVDLHHGVIRAESEGDGHGATFTVELPVSPAISAIPASPTQDGTASPHVPADANGPGIASPARQSATAMRLLLVEDHQPTLEVLTRLLERSGHRVVGVSSLASAREAAASQTFDAMISDLGLPDGGGTTLMSELRDAYGLRGIALSGYGMEEDLRRSREAGFITHLVKPVDMNEVRRALELIRPGVE